MSAERTLLRRLWLRLTKRRQLQRFKPKCCCRWAVNSSFFMTTRQRRRRFNWGGLDIGLLLVELHPIDLGRGSSVRRHDSVPSGLIPGAVNDGRIDDPVADDDDVASLSGIYICQWILLDRSPYVIVWLILQSFLHRPIHPSRDRMLTLIVVVVAPHSGHAERDEGLIVGQSIIK